MQGGTSFADVLDAHLGCTPAPPVRPAVSNRPLTAPLFAFDLPPAAAAPRRTTAYPRLHTVAPADHVAARTVRVEQPAHVQPAEPKAPPRLDTPPVAPRVVLTALEARALKALNALGAGLDEPLTLDTLRGAFRRLARCYHPDRHPGSGAAERARLAQLFADATGHYRLLAASLDARLNPRA
jgi:hypothetical protein